MIKLNEKKQLNFEHVLIEHLSSSQLLSSNVQYVHWNYTGKDFIPVHHFLGDLYEKLIEFDDELAERMRAIQLIVDSRMSTVIKLSRIHDIKPKDHHLRQLVDNMKILEKHGQDCIHISSHDDVLVDHFTDRLEHYGKAIWMLEHHC